MEAKEAVCQGTDSAETKLSGRKLTATQVKELATVLNRYRDVLSDKPGKVEGVAHEINTGDAPPYRAMPYRLCLELHVPRANINVR